MNKLNLAGIIFVCLSALFAEGNVDITKIDVPQKGAYTSPNMFGVFFEEINHAGDGGLYAELVQNRSFEELEMPAGYRAEGDKLFPNEVKDHISGEVRKQSFRWTKDAVPAWSLKAPSPDVAEIKLTKFKPKFDSAPNNLEISIKDNSVPVQLINSGYWGMGIKKDSQYFLRTIIRTSKDFQGTIFAKIISANNEVLASAQIKSKPEIWNEVNLTLTASNTDNKAKLLLEFKGSGKIWLDYVSLFPKDTFRARKNGLRKDVAQMIVDLKAKFFRWPGGCVVEGISLNNRFEWKKTLGDVAARSCEYSTWGYRCSYGLGYHEMLQFCEDIKAEAMYVCNVGMGCQYRMADASKESEIEYYLNDCLDAIEYAIGKVDSPWGKKRAAAGHPEPFPLKYVEIGNENWGAEYDKRFDIFYKAIKQKYPDLILISNHGINNTGKITKTDMVDPHWYVTPDFFFSNSKIFDDVKRGNYTVYVGEYACNSNVGSGNMLAALSEAAFISGMERNGDLVKMASYAPLFENKNDRCWATNLIWIDTDKVMGRSSYYVQKMAAENRVDYNLKLEETTTAKAKIDLKKGSLALGSWQTKVEFKDAKITINEKTQKLDLASGVPARGTWKFDNSILSQTSSDKATKYDFKNICENDFTFEVQAKKIGGNEGFLLYYTLFDNAQKGYVINVGGWNNSAIAVEKVANGTNAGVEGKQLPFKMDSDKWVAVKLVVTPKKATLFLDGKEIISHLPEGTPQQFFAAGVDQKANEIVIKTVNASDKTFVRDFAISGANVAPSGDVITLSADSSADENTFENPQKIYPQKEKFGGFGKSFRYEFKPFSYTILRIKIRK